MLKVGFEYRGETYLLQPEEDLTAVELAEIVALLFNLNRAGSPKVGGVHIAEKLSVNAARHFPGLGKALKP